MQCSKAQAVERHSVPLWTTPDIKYVEHELFLNLISRPISPMKGPSINVCEKARRMEVSGLVLSHINHWFVSTLIICFYHESLNCQLLLNLPSQAVVSTTNASISSSDSVSEFFLALSLAESFFHDISLLTTIITF